MSNQSLEHTQKTARSAHIFSLSFVKWRNMGTC